MTRDPRLEPKRHDRIRANGVIREVERIRDHGGRVDYTDGTFHFTVRLSRWQTDNRDAEVLHCAE